MKTIAKLSIGVGLALAAPGMVMAQTAPAPAPAEVLDPARIAASREVIDLVMPPEDRDTMIDNIVRPMMASMQEAVMSAPGISDGIGKKPAVRAVFDRYMTRTTERTLVALRAGMPDMLDAMVRAYARRFSVQELTDIGNFLRTPSGRAYVRQSSTIMSDPDVVAWQRKLIQGSMQNVQAETEQVIAELREAMAKS